MYQTLEPTIKIGALEPFDMFGVERIDQKNGKLIYTIKISDPRTTLPVHLKTYNYETALLQLLGVRDINLLVKTHLKFEYWGNEIRIIWKYHHTSTEDTALRRVQILTLVDTLKEHKVAFIEFAANPRLDSASVDLLRQDLVSRLSSVVFS